MAPRAAESAAVAQAVAKGGLLLKPGVDEKAARAYVPKDVEEDEPPRMGSHYTGPLGDNHKGKPLYKRLNYLHLFLLTATPAAALYGLVTVPFNWRTYLFAFVYYFISGVGITAGYHRLFAHRAYKATFLMRVILMLMGTAAVEGSIRWWARDHRAHHRYVDTDKDPYSAAKGFFYAHMGWMLVKQEPGKIGRADKADLYQDPVITFQHRFYLPLMLLMAFIVPTVICGLGWGDWAGGYFIGGALRLTMVHHSTFCVNSLAHYAGAATYTDGHTARNSWITALVTMGEGYHNFHHEFPTDYRNAVEWWQFDPTKVFIWLFSLVGMTYDLNTFPSNEIVKGQLQMAQKALDASKRELYWGPDPTALREISEDEFKAGVAAGAKWVKLHGFVLDVAKWAAQHPGGERLLLDRVGSDISLEFTDADEAKGGYYKHSNAGKNLAATLRVARIKGYWK